MLPAWLAALVVVRDTAQIGGMAWYRARTFGYRWPGAARFFSVDGGDGAVGAAGGGGERDQRLQATRRYQQEQTYGAGDGSGSAAADSQAAGGAAAGGGLPVMRPHPISKANTALVLGLVCACIAQEWQGVPGPEVLAAIEAACVLTTAASGAIYLRQYVKGELLPP